MSPQQSDAELLKSLESKQTGEEFGTRESGSNVPVGDAVMRIDNVWLQRTQKKNYLQLATQCTILEHSASPEIVGGTYQKSWGLETDENFAWLNGDLVNLELDPVKRATLAADIDARMKQMASICFNTVLVENNERGYPPVSFINAGARRRDLEGGKAVPPPAKGGSNF